MGLRNEEPNSCQRRRKPSMAVGEFAISKMSLCGRRDQLAMWVCGNE
ncbi:DOG1 domain-containing protein [Psidium guajava]|nr:DOG1 domain-containing protein [Psidium guajava]